MKKTAIAMLGAFLAIASAPAHATTFNIASGFSLTNPGGNFTYGYESTLGGTLTPFTDLVSTPGYNQWRTTATDPYLGVYGQTDGSLYQHPGPGGLFSVIRLTVPTAGTYTISGAWTTGGASTTDQHILVDGSSQFSGVVNGSQATDPFGFTMNLLVGDTVDFILGDGGNGYASDTTYLAATVASAVSNSAIPEPASWALLLAGFGVVARMRRRSSSASAA